MSISRFRSTGCTWPARGVTAGLVSPSFLATTPRSRRWRTPASRSDPDVGVLPIPVADPALEELAGILAWQVVVEHDEFGNLESGELVPDVGAHLVFGQRESLADLDVCGQRFAVLLVGDAEDSAVRDRGHLIEHRLDLGGVNVDPA